MILTGRKNLRCSVTDDEEEEELTHLQPNTLKSVQMRAHVQANLSKAVKGIRADPQFKSGSFLQ